MMCAEIRDKLVDFLYDELPANTRDAITEHLDGCPSCKAEMASFRRTLGDARAALHGPLLEEPPMRVRLAVLQAAEAANRGMAAAPRENKAPPRDGFFTRLFRAPWFLPAFGAASVATVVFLVRVLKDPEVVPGQTPHALEERNAAAPKAAPAVAPALPEPMDDDSAAQPPPQPHLSKPEAMPAKTRRPIAAAAAARDDAREERALGMLGGKGRGTGSGPRAAAPATFAEPPAQASRAKAAKDLDNLLGETSGRRFAAPPPPRPASAVDEPRAIAKKKVSNDPLAGMDLGDRRIESESAPAPAEAAAPAPAAAAASHKQEADRDAGPTLEESVRKADRLYANQDWNTAAEAYRDLIRRFPRHKDVARWRERANAATTAYQRSLDVKSKKARTDDAMDGLKL